MRSVSFLFITILLIYGCNFSNQSSLDKKKTIKLKEVKSAKVEVAYIFEHDLSMYNRSYFMRITPTLDSFNLDHKYTILLIQDKDTIFNKKINLDSITNKTLNNRVVIDGVNKESIKKNFYLSKIVYHAVRANNIYFEASFKSRTQNNYLKGLFYLQYLHKNDLGKMTFHALNLKGFGSNKGEKDHINNRKILLNNVKGDYKVK